MTFCRLVLLIAYYNLKYTFFIRFENTAGIAVISNLFHESCKYKLSADVNQLNLVNFHCSLSCQYGYFIMAVSGVQDSYGDNHSSFCIHLLKP